jgi:hypothetical protein
LKEKSSHRQHKDCQSHGCDNLNLGRFGISTKSAGATLMRYPAQGKFAAVVARATVNVNRLQNINPAIDQSIEGLTIIVGVLQRNSIPL